MIKKIITYNVNGLRAAMNKDFASWLKEQAADVICLQEIKANEDQINLSVFTDMGYNCYWFSAQKKGYSGVAIFSKQTPKHVEYGCGNELYDFEGRVIRIDFDSHSIMSVYHPSGTTGDERQAFKMAWLAFFQNYLLELRTKIPNLILCGDYNICNKAIDIHNPKSNKDSSGFLPEEREWFDKFLESGFIDTFRYVCKEPHHYTWWSYRANAREKNLGWRIDYNIVSNSLESNINTAYILANAKHSDHCPCVLEIDLG
jgi:exodeoxyribonuclease-3